ncbi:MAG: PKD domain-containing protein [Dinghuibacter sp.]|nr:PKD domain-containing protein [Dinghuibacter sp.]
MNKFLLSACIMLFILAGCSKGTTNEQGGIVSDPAQALKPVAAFAISNMVNNTVGEGRILAIANQSRNGFTYLWDFGNGVTSTEQTPSYYYPLHGIYRVTLKVTATNGQTATATQELTVFCGRTNPNHVPLTAPEL